MKLEENTWYWISHPQEGDVYYPVYVRDEDHIDLDGKNCKYHEIKELNFDKAVMPEYVSARS